MPDELEIRLVRDVRDMEAVYRLTHECYVARGFAEAQASGLLLHYPEFDVVPETIVLVAYLNHELVGSVSFTTAGRDGLTIAHDFQKECRAMEKEGREIAAIWRLVVKESCRSSRQVLIGLIAELFRRGLQSRVNTWLFVVNPRHERVYQRLINMRVVARKESTGGLSNAPAVLLRGDRETLPAQWHLADLSIQSNEPLGLATLASLIDPHDIPGVDL